MMSDARDTLSLAQLGKRWGKDERTIRRWKDAGELGFLFRIGSAWRARLNDVEAFEDRKKIDRPKQRNTQSKPRNANESETRKSSRKGRAA